MPEAKTIRNASRPSPTASQRIQADRATESLKRPIKASALGQKDEALQAYQAAIDSGRHLEPHAQVSYIPHLEKKLRKL